jgi:hypothetical protein
MVGNGSFEDGIWDDIWGWNQSCAGNRKSELPEIGNGFKIGRKKTPEIGKFKNFFLNLSTLKIMSSIIIVIERQIMVHEKKALYILVS